MQIQEALAAAAVCSSGAVLGGSTMVQPRGTPAPIV